MLDRALDEVTIDDLRGALAAADDEDDRWEAKGETLRAEHVFKPAAGLANRDGGLLLLGVSRDADGGWRLDGSRFTGEPGHWIARVIRDNLTPPPQYLLRVFEISTDRHVVLVRVEPHPNHLSITRDGRVLRREHGSTEPLTDGAELTRLIQQRAGSGPAAALDPDASPGELGDAALTVLEADQEARLRAFIARLRIRIVRAAQFEHFEVLQIEADRLSAIAGALVQAAPESAVTSLAIEAHHRVFDAAVHLRPPPNSRAHLDLFRVVLRNTRALGALLVRLELWPTVTALAAHDVPGDDIYPGWMTYIAVQQARASNFVNAETMRHTVREARDAAMRVPALRPDAADEHEILNALLVFDLATNLVELDRAERARRRMEVSPDFAVFDEDPLRPISARILNDADIREALLPERRQRDVARLLMNVDEQARRVANSCAGIWGGIADQRTSQQLQAITSATIL